MSKIQSFTDLVAWQVAMELVEAVYVATRAIPNEEKYGLQAQMRRAAVSVPANIAEGQGRNHLKEYVQFLGIALGSLAELETYIRLTHRLGLLPEDEALLTLTRRTGQLVSKLKNALMQSSADNGIPNRPSSASDRKPETEDRKPNLI